MKKFRASLCLLLTTLAWAKSPAPKTGSVSGTVIDKASGRQLEYITVSLQNTSTKEAIRTVATDRQGSFRLENVPVGEYRISYAPLGAEAEETKPFSVTTPDTSVKLGQLELRSSVLTMDKFEVSATRAAQLNSIDRKTYNVGKDLQSATGNASDLLQNVPSVQVDIDGNVSLRGSGNVLILINGRPSTLMGKSRAEVLQQLPADSIDKIEVVTNPSAIYKPDGTAGIINISLKKQRDPGYSGTVTVAAGNDRRGNVGISANYNPGKLNLFASLSLRQDDRLRRATDTRTVIDPESGLLTQATKTTIETSRPLSRVARLGIDYDLSENDKVALSANYNRRTLLRRATDFNIWSVTGASELRYERTRIDPEYEEGREIGASWQHSFGKEGHELSMELKSSSNEEVEDNHYTNTYQSPATPTTTDNTRIAVDDKGMEAVVDYVYPINDDSKLEAGYNLTTDRLFQDFLVDSIDPVTGKTRSNQFRHDEAIHAFYMTYARNIGKLGVLAGLRPEFALTKSDLLTTREQVSNDYARVYPSLHLAWHFTDKHEVQANYSHRVRRPEADELNPFPEYSDPYNLRAGNPKLLPEDIHSLEFGYCYKGDSTGFTSTIYHRELYNGFTSVTRSLGDGVLLTTHENLSTSRSSGLEITANADLGKWATLNFSSNTFLNTIDASNLGFSSGKSDMSWAAKLGATLHLTKNDLLQFNTNYSSSRLTPQGSKRPSFVANTGLRHDFARKKYSLILTVSDLFNSQKEATRIDTPLLKEEIVRRRSSRIVYVGFIYTFGKASKKPKDDPMKFDNAM